MRHEELERLMREEFDRMIEIRNTKGHDYAGDEDALENFKDAAHRMAMTPLQIWWVYADKHWDAVTTYCREGQVKSEAIEGRIRDVVVYCFLLLGILWELENEMEEGT